MSIVSAQASKQAADEIPIGEWRLAVRGNELRKGGEVVRLEPKAAEVLAFLAGRPGDVVGREDLMAAVWPGVVVGDDALTQAVIKLRKALGDDAHAPTYIETISKRGYRLVAPVGRRVPDPDPRVEPRMRGPGLSWRRAAALFAVSAIIAAAAVWLAIPRLPWPVGSTTPERAPAASLPTVAVLPLANLSGDPARDYFTDGLTEDFINALGHFSGVRVMSRSAVQGFKGRNPTPQAVGAELGARYLVQGTARESQGRTRITVQLAETGGGTLLWSDQYDAEGAQLFEIQERIVRQIVGALHVKLTEIEQGRAFRLPTDSLEAYDLVLQARALITATKRDSNRRARELLARAQKLAPEYAEVPVVQSEAELQRVLFGWIEDAEEGLRRALELSGRALSLPDAGVGTHSRAHVVISSVATLRDRNDEALANADRALELNPSDSRALARRGSALVWLGRIDEAIPALETTRRLDPNATAAMMTPLAVAYYTAGRYAEAIAECERIGARFPHVADSYAIRAAALAQLGREGEAREAAAQVKRLNPLFLVEQWGTRFSAPEHRTRLQDGLRKAGL